MACLIMGGLNHGFFDYRWSLSWPVWLLLVFIKTCLIIGGPYYVACLIIAGLYLNLSYYR